MTKELQAATTTALQPQADVFANFEMIERVATTLARAKTAIPPFLRNNIGDCTAVVAQAMQWQISPFFLAQETYQVNQNAMLAYGAKVFNAVVTKNAPIVGRPRYEMIGDWSRVQGKVVKKRSQHGKEYVAPGWNPEDEIGLGVDVIVHLKGETEPLRERVLLSSCHPRNSTLWANDPAQQIKYAAIRKIARIHFTDVLAGAVFVDEFEAPAERDITDQAETVQDLVNGQAAQEKGQPSEEEQIRDFLHDIDNAKNLNRLRTIGNQIKDAPTAVQDAIRAGYQYKMAELKPKPKQTEETPSDAAVEAADPETGEIPAETKEPDDGPDNGIKDVSASQVQKIIETAPDRETLDDCEDMIKDMDKRTSDYKNLADMIAVRREEMTH